jgi:hypothetical protein
VAEASWPSPTHNDRSVTDAEYPHLASLGSDGVFPSTTDIVYANSSGREVHVRAGKYALVQGHAWNSGSSEFNLTIAANSSGSTRVDTVVLKLDRSTWNVTAAVHQGTAGAGAPSLQRDSGDTGAWEIPLADVTVDNGASTIAGNKVKPRTLWQAGGGRPCTVITDIQETLVAGDLVYESSTGRWIAWTGSTGTVVYHDTGWITVPSASGTWAAGSLLNRIRRRNGVAYLSGAFVRASGSFSGVSPSPIANLSSQFVPSLQQHNWMAWTIRGGARMRVETTGLLSIVDAIGNMLAGDAVYIDTCWLVD